MELFNASVALAAGIVLVVDNAGGSSSGGGVEGSYFAKTTVSGLELAQEFKVRFIMRHSSTFIQPVG